MTAAFKISILAVWQGFFYEVIPLQTLEELHPVTILLYFSAIAGIAMFCMNPILLLCSFTGAILYFFILNKLKFLKRHFYSFLLFLILTLINPLVSHNGVTVLFVLNDNPVTLESLLYGADSALMILSVLYWLGLFTQIMTSEKILCIFGTFSPKIALFLSMTLRFVPLLNSQWKKVCDTQKTLGYFQSDNIIDRIKDYMRVFDIVLTWSLENGIITANSMDARGSGIGKRTSFSIHHFQKQDFILIFIIILLTGMIIFVICQNALEINFYPAVSMAELNFLSIIGLSAYFLLALLPSVIQIEVSLKWKFLQSKI